ncbi:indole-3-glycerol phosphate synthase TrpC [bacterium]|nr:indole-3-glycerol phosphate synthase TrpC [bacterium]
MTDFGPILTRIVKAKREEVAALRSRSSLDEMKARAADAPPPRDFLAAVTRPGRVNLIAEVKKASPSKGLIRPDFDPVAIARSYVEGGASAISVLTDEKFFQGSLDIFRSVRAAVDLPLLRKEFMVDPIQFYEARTVGADAVLLITSILTSGQLADFHDLAVALGMTPLLETHSEADIRRAMAETWPVLLGVNNRDLGDAKFQTDLGHTGRMIPLIRQLTKDRADSGSKYEGPPVVSESGIYTANDVARLAEMGISAVLVGESLMRQDNPGQAARDLMVRSASVRL